MVYVGPNIRVVNETDAVGLQLEHELTEISFDHVSFDMNQRIKAKDEIHGMIWNHFQRLHIVDMVGEMAVGRKPLLASFDTALRQIDHAQVLTEIFQVLRAP